MMSVGQNQLVFGPGTGHDCSRAIAVRGSRERRILDLGIEAWLSTAYPDHDSYGVRNESDPNSGASYEVHSIRSTNGAEFEICFELPRIDPG